MIEEDDDDSSDEELAPMVDGLSGTLCIIILVSMVFIFSGMKTAETYINYGELRFEETQIDLQKKRIYFKGGIHLSNSEISLLNNEIIKSKNEKIIISSYINDRISHSKEKSTYNLLYMASLIKNLGINKEVVLKQGTSEYCPGWNSCIYWDYK
ncbi:MULTISPECIES: hypothetical protein [unclassified Providencia]|uniref:hypothetical protein n=1 Tax=unclassified Providencia TaxID=2633465 RepID=UPI000E93AD9E|nr:hypothetical protein [Providencia sp.]MBP6081193.1 hypothetical protein [Providencia sp.]HBO21409.1 hypothetical protein [Providencia sp.]